MNVANWIRRVGLRSANRSKRRRQQSARFVLASAAIECLEDRALLAAFVVDTVVDESDGNMSAGDVSLREAIEAANAAAGADTISFDAGVFGSSQTITLTLGEYAITDSVTITGPGQERLTIDADQQSRIFNIDDGDENNLIDVAISGMTVTNGFETDGDDSLPTPEESGGGIISRESFLLTSVTVENSESKASGGGILAIGPSEFIGITVQNNIARTFGGGIFLNTDTVRITESSINANRAFSNGGGIANWTSARTTISRSTIADNQGSAGGGLTNEGTIEVISSLITRNRAGGGGGIFNSRVASVTDSTISMNVATGDGGGIRQFEFAPTMEIIRTTIVNNTSEGGSGIRGRANFDVSHSIIAGNVLDAGVPDDLDLDGRTIGGVFNLIGDPNSAGGMIDGTDGNIVGQDDGSGGRELLDVATVLASLADNGGPTQTHALIPGSPAIDAGDPNFDPSSFDPPALYDQRGTGFDRVVNGNQDLTPRIDIGAFEFPVAATLVVEHTDNFTEVPEEGSDTITVALTKAPASSVTVSVSAATPPRVSVDASSLTFTEANWNIPQVVTISGIADGVQTGDLVTAIDFSVINNLSGDDFDGAAGGFAVTFLDKESIVPAIEVTGPVGTSENRQPTITWTELDEAVSYQVWLQLIGSDSNPVLNTTVTGTSVSPAADVGDLQIGSYRSWVRANFADGGQSDWATGTFQVDGVPSILPLPADNNLRPTISWAAIGGATSYRIFIRNQTSGEIVADTTVQDRTFTPETNFEFGEHHIWVRAIGVGNYQGTWSSRATYSVSPAQTAPVGAILDSPAQFTWTTVEGAATHQIYITGPGVLINESGITGNSFTPATPLPDGDYRWWIRGVAADGATGPWGDPAEFTTGGRTHISTPLTFNAVGIPEISWPQVPDAQEYDVYISKAGTPGAFSRTTVSPSAQYNVPALNNGDYRVWIRTTLADGSTVWGRGVAFTIDASVSDINVAPTAPIGGTFGGSTTFSWQPAAGASSYDVYFLNDTPAPVGGAIHDGLRTEVSGTSVDVASLSTGDWTWWLRARDAAGVPGPWSIGTKFNTNGRVTGVTASVSTSNIPTINWQPIATAARYALQINNLTTGEQSVIRIDDLTDFRYTAPTAFTSGTYRIWVRAITSGNIAGPWSVQQDFTVA